MLAWACTDRPAPDAGSADTADPVGEPCTGGAIVGSVVPFDEYCVPDEPATAWLYSADSGSYYDEQDLVEWAFGYLYLEPGAYNLLIMMSLLPTGEDVCLYGGGCALDVEDIQVCSEEVSLGELELDCELLIR